MYDTKKPEDAHMKLHAYKNGNPTYKLIKVQ